MTVAAPEDPTGQAVNLLYGAIGVAVVIAALVRAVVSDKSWRDRARPQFIRVVLTLVAAAAVLSLAAARLSD
jgi:hypothetical protein